MSSPSKQRRAARVSGASLDARKLAMGVAAAMALVAGAGARGHAAEPGIRALVEVSDITGVSVAPDGRTAVFRTHKALLDRNSYRLAWHSVDLETGAAREIGDGGMPIYVDPGLIRSETPLWGPDGSSIYYPALIDGAIGIWRARVDGSGSRAVLIRDADVEALELAPDGRSLLYKVGPSRAEIERAERSEYDRGILVDKSVDLAQNLYRGGSVDGRTATERLVGYWYVRAGLLWKAPRQKRRLDLATLADTAHGPAEPVQDFSPPQRGAAASAKSSGGEEATANWDGREGSLSVSGRGDGVRCWLALCRTVRIAALAWRPGHRQLLVTFQDRHHRQTLHLWDVARNRWWQVTKGEGLLSGGRLGRTPCTVSRTAAICVAASAASPPRLERIDLGTGARTILFDPNDTFRAAYRPRVEPLSWASGDRIATGILLLPAAVGRDRRPRPLFINYYRCEGFLRGGEGDEWPLPSLLAAGFAVACLNAAPVIGAQDAKATYEAALSDVASFLALIQSRGIADRRKVAMGGLSFGSEAAMWIARHTDLLAVLSIASVQYEPGAYWLSAVRGNDQAKAMETVWGLGAPDRTMARWKLMSAALNIERLRAPLLMQLPEQEARKIPELYSRLTNSATPAELYAFPDEAHIKLQPRHRLAAYERNLDWFRYWLQDHVDSDPAKAAQYSRWDELRERRRQAGSAAP